ncbi:hypothetical protein PENNAL_c0014G10461 [Penicillium nalgiovense]|uniref:Uncharacterized protein n=1 Tax=Penicillium nalgiovense TaxID=60175 RepID=A0A1V6YQR3_PENNA|nr:hypothetical protein PENNAL_c0014G10461 [Penicillium nalgiovense]
MSNLPDGYVVQHYPRSAANNRQKPSTVVASLEAGGIQNKPTNPQGMVAYLGSVEDKETLAACVGKMIMEAPLL